MKTILVPAGGSDSDLGIFETALAAARPFAAHLDFYHVKVDAGEAVVNTTHAGFAMGPGLQNTLELLHSDAEARAAAARAHVEQFCTQNNIPMRERPSVRKEVSGFWTEEAGESVPLFIRRARYSDLVVMGRRRSRNQLPENLLERLLLRSGRPILVAPARARPTLLGTAMICWKESAEAVRAVAAAIPLLRNAEQVLIVGVSEANDADTLAAVDSLARHLAWHGVRAQPRCIAPNGRTVASALYAAAQDFGVDLVVMGGYSHSRIREMIFGGCTDAFLRAADAAVLLVH